MLGKGLKGLLACAGADCGNLVTYICTAYNGKRPEICNEPQSFQKCPGAPTQDTAFMQAKLQRNDMDQTQVESL